MKQFAKQARNGAYFVKRGFINWAEFDFETNKRAISILVDEEGLFPDKRGMENARISMEIFTSISKSTEPVMIDDGVMDELIEDARWIVNQLEQAKNKQGENVALKIDKHASNLVESHDATLGVQGIVAIIRVTY